MSVKGRAAAYTPWIAIRNHTAKEERPPRGPEQPADTSRVVPPPSPDEGDDYRNADEEDETAESRESDQPEDDSYELVARCAVEVVGQRVGLPRPVAVPTLNTKAPCTGCESAEMTRHATTYVPFGRCGGRDMATAWLSPGGWCVPPRSTRLPSGPMTRSDPKSISTGSPKCRTTCDGDVKSTDDGSGWVLSNWA